MVLRVTCKKPQNSSNPIAINAKLVFFQMMHFFWPRVYGIETLGFFLKQVFCTLLPRALAKWNTLQSSSIGRWKAISDLGFLAFEIWIWDFSVFQIWIWDFKCIWNWNLDVRKHLKLKFGLRPFWPLSLWHWKSNHVKSPLAKEVAELDGSLQNTGIIPSMCNWLVNYCGL